MRTLADIIEHGNAAATAGAPLVINWPQARGAILLFGHRCGGPEQVCALRFSAAYPEEYDALDLREQAAFGSARLYQSARREVLRVLAVVGAANDPWEQLRVLIRRAGRSHDIENTWYALRRPALDADLTPSDIRTDWVWALDAEATGGFKRQSLRRAATLFNEMFLIPEIAASGLLPPEPIGPPPIYDWAGRLHIDLPPRLAHYQSCGPRQGLPAIWRALCAAGTIGLPEDPSADDVLAPETWARIEALPYSVTHHIIGTWHLYLTQARATLRPHATRPLPERLPPHYDAMITSGTDRSALKVLWRRICERGSVMLYAKPEELLELATWRDLWRHIPIGIAPKTWSVHEGRARKLLVRHTGLTDPYRQVTRAWADLPPQAKSILHPIRKSAERALLRPLDLAPDWVEAQNLNAAERVQIVTALREVFFAAVQLRAPDPLFDPAALDWETLRTAIRAQGLRWMGLSKVATASINDGLAPVDLTPGWATATAAGMDFRTRAKFAFGLRQLDSLLGTPELAELLYALPISALPDARKRGKLEPPAEMLCEADTATAAQGRAASTRREARATVRSLWTAAAKGTGGTSSVTLAELLSATDVLDLDPRIRANAARLLSDMRSIQQGE